MAAPTAVSYLDDLDVGTYLKIYAAKGVYNALPDQSDAWKLLMKRKKKAAEGREHRFNVRSGLGIASAQFVTVDGGAYPKGYRSTLNEGLARFKDYAMTVDVPRTLLDKGMSDLAVYGQPLAEELDAQGIAIARVLSAALYRDGTGVIGVLSGDPTASTSADTIVITLSSTDANSARSHIGYFEINDQVRFVTSGGTEHDSSSGTSITGDTAVAYWKITAKDDDARTVTLQAYNSSDTLIAISATTINADDPSDGDYVIRKGITANDLSAISTTDYNTLSEEWPGLESLGQDDGRKVNGITLSGNLAGTRYDCSAANIDSSHFQKGLSLVKRRVGKNKYKYATALMFDTAYDACVEAGETDRRFAALDDIKRGTKGVGYRHGKDTVEFLTDEFCPEKRIIMLPESSEVLHFIGSEFKFVQPNGNDKFHLGVNSDGQHTRNMKAYMEGNGTLCSLQSAAILTLHNFVA